MDVLAMSFGNLIVVNLIGLFVVYLFGLLLGTVVHELGHAFAALLATGQKVEVQVGRGSLFSFRLGRLDFSLGKRGLRYGFTRYDRGIESRGAQTFVALAGPFATLSTCVLTGWLAYWEVPGSVMWSVWLGLFVANFRILIVSVWPIAYRPDGPEGEEWLSDALDIWRLWRG